MRRATHVRRLPVGFLLLFLVGAGAVRAADPQPRPLDLYGDSLPDGAVWRLGTLRLVHLGDLTAVGVSPDGKVVASGVRNGKETYLGVKTQHESGGFSVGEGVRVTNTALRLWDTKSGRLIREIETPDAPVTVIQFASDCRTLFAGCGTRLCMWDTATGKKAWDQEALPGGVFHYGVFVEKILLAGDRLITLHGGTLMSTVNHDGGFSCFYRRQKLVRLWDARTGKPLPLPTELESTIRAEGPISTLFHEVAVSSDGRYAAVLTSTADPEPRTEGGSNSKWKFTEWRLHIVDLRTGKIVHTLPGDKEAFPASGNEGASSGFTPSRYGTGEFAGLTFDRAGTTLAVAAGKSIWLVRMDNGRKAVFAQDQVEPVRGLVFDGDDKRLSALLGHDSVRVWDMTSRRCVEDHPVREQDFEMARGGPVGVAIRGDTLRLTNLDSGKPLHSFAGHRSAPLVRFAFQAPDTLLSRDAQKMIRWDTRSWKPTESLTIPEEAQSWWYSRRSNAMDCNLAPEKRYYVREGKDHVELRDLRSDRLVHVLNVEPAKNRRSATLCPAGNRLVLSGDESWQFFDVETGKRLAVLPRRGNIAPSDPSALSPHGRFFTQGQRGQTSEVFDINSGKSVIKFDPEQGGKVRQGFTQAFWYSGDDRYLLSEFQETVKGGGFSEQKTLLLVWDLWDGKLVQELAIQPSVQVFWREVGMKSRLRAVAMSNDHRFVAVVAEAGKSIGIWETASGTLRGELTGHTGPVVDVAFSPDGRQLASSSEDTTILIWDLNRPLQPCKCKDRLTREELIAQWQMLSQPDATKADVAIWGLVNAPADSLAFLRQHLRPAAQPDGKRVAALLATLDNDDFDTRKAALTELDQYGERVLEELQTAAGQRNSLDKQYLLKELLQKARRRAELFGTPENLVEWRAVEVLERIASDDARQYLRELSRGVPSATLTVAARAVLSRLEPTRELRR